MNRIIMLFISVACLGCQRAPMATPPQAAPPMAAVPASETSEPVATEPAISAEEIFDTLTAHSWKTLPLAQGYPDHSVATFRADGTYSYDFFTDHHVPTKTGKWNLQSLKGQWYLCQDDGRRVTIAVNEDGTITPHHGKLHPHKPLQREPGQTAKTLPPLVLLPEVQEIARRLTAHNWKRTNDIDLRMSPTMVRFRPDWTYVATYRHGQCHSEGTWSAKPGEVGGTSPKSRCDDRPGTGGDSLRMEVIDDRKILVNGELYVPEDEPLPRGIIWRLFGYDQVAIRIEYNMPIRRGMPTRFDVTITNSGRDTIQLDRFSLSRAYSNYGRGVGDRGQALVLPGDELAGQDLASKSLAPGQSHTFSVTAQFPQAELQWVYFNGLVTGTTQNWDIHQVHELAVKE